MTIASGPIGSTPIAAEAQTGSSPAINLSSTVEMGGTLEIQPIWLGLGSTFTLGSTLSEFGEGFVLSSGFSMTSSLSVQLATQFVSRMAFASSLDIQLNGNIDLTTVMEMQDSAVISHVLELMDTIGLGGSIDIEHLKVLDFVTTAVFDTSITTSANWAVNLASAMAIRSILAYGYDLDLLDTMGLASAFELRYNAVLEFLTTAEGASTLDVGRQIMMLFTSTGEIDSTLDTQANLHLDFFDAMVGQTVFKLGDDLYQGWVFSTEHRAFTEYSNYPFNSIAQYGAFPYGVSEDGIYKLDGDDDDGTQIDAAVKTKLTSFRERALKDAKSVYIGYTGSGKLVLKVTVDRGGKLHEYWYEQKQGATDSLRTGRFDPQRGLRSSYWQFEIINQDGADFDLEDVTILYQVLSRRIR